MNKRVAYINTLNLIHTPYIGIFLNSIIILSFSLFTIYTFFQKIPYLKG